jgi:peptidoglycan/xylan/chitin deacetylase (PgdA/CDA1 family)
MFHDIKKKNFYNLQSSLQNLKKNYNFIDPNQLKEKYILKDKNNLLLTFDDGFKSNFFFANTVLKKLKIKAIFFVVTDLVSSNIINKKKTIQNIFPEQKLHKISKYKTMTWNDLRKLEKMGHVIGSHTKSHLKLNTIKSKAVLKTQIISPRNFFKKNKIKIPKFFAYSFGDFDSFNEKCFKIAKKKYQFIFSGIRGDNIKSNKILFRDNIVDNYNLNMIKFYIYGYSDFLYSRFRKIFLSF